MVATEGELIFAVGMVNVFVFYFLWYAADAETCRAATEFTECFLR